MTLLTTPYSDQLTKETLTALNTGQQPPCLSIYLPMVRKGAETQQNAIRLKNLHRQATEELTQWRIQHPDRITASAADELLQPLGALADDQAFLQHQSEGLAIFLTPERNEHFQLPTAVEERVVIGESFWLRPLIPLLSEEDDFYLLTLNQGGVQLLRANRHILAPVELGDAIPQSLAEALRFDDFERHLQYHTQTGMATDGGGRAAMYHGQGGADEASNTENILRFFRALDNGVRDLLEGGTHPPLVLAGLPFLQGLYRQVNRYNNLLEDGIDHDPEATTLAELHERAWTCVAPIFQADQARAVDQYQHLQGNHDERAMAKIEAVVPAAYFQRVDTLFLLSDEPVWGAFDVADNQVELHTDYQPGDNDLMNFAAIHTLLNGGTVYDMTAPELTAPLTGKSAVAAILRY